MPTDLDLARATVAPLVEALASRRLSALEACDAAIARIEAGDGAINAVVVRDFERAREQARAVDAALARGERRALLGVPMTVKEAFDIAGLPTTWGVAPFRSHVARRDAAAVERLKAAGAVILGKTNVPPALADWQSANPIHGRTLNPLDATRTPGGSSGGSAAALAAGFVPLEVGSDIGGSIRVPAHCCGVFGHKSSHGLLPMRGHDFPGSDGVESTELGVIGPMARTAADLMTALDVLAGPDGDDAVAWRLALPPPHITTLRGARLLVLDTHPVAPTDAAVRGAIDALAADLAREGASVARASEGLPELAEAHRRYLKMLLTATTRGAPGAPPSISAHEWLGLRDDQHRLRRQWAALFKAFDAVIAPVFGTLAFAHTDEPDWRQRTLIVDGEPTPYGDQLGWPGVATFPGLPATAMPVGRDATTGLPIAAQLIGPRFEDRTPIALAALIEALGR